MKKKVSEIKSKISKELLLELLEKNVSKRKICRDHHISFQTLKRMLVEDHSSCYTPPPKKEYKHVSITKEEFEKLCSIFCTLNEMALFFDCSTESVRIWCVKNYGKNFEDIYKEKSIYGIISIRRKQMQVAMNGNASMLIFLGKQYLGQEDKNSSRNFVRSISMVQKEEEERLKKEYTKEELQEYVWNDKNPIVEV